MSSSSSHSRRSSSTGRRASTSCNGGRRTSRGLQSFDSDEEELEQPLATLEPLSRVIGFCCYDDNSSPVAVISVTSRCHKSIAFKVKSSSPESYQVVPNRCVICPYQCADITIKFTCGDTQEIPSHRFAVVAIRLDKDIERAEDLKARALWTPKPDNPSVYLELNFRCCLMQRRNTSSPCLFGDQPSPTILYSAAPSGDRVTTQWSTPVSSVTCPLVQDTRQAELEAALEDRRQQMSYINQQQTSMTIIFAFFLLVALLVCFTLNSKKKEQYDFFFNDTEEMMAKLRRHPT